VLPPTGAPLREKFGHLEFSEARGKWRGGVLVSVEEGSVGFDGAEEVDAVQALWFMD